MSQVIRAHEFPGSNDALGGSVNKLDKSGLYYNMCLGQGLLLTKFHLNVKYINECCFSKDKMFHRHNYSAKLSCCVLKATRPSAHKLLMTQGNLLMTFILKNDVFLPQFEPKTNYSSKLERFEEMPSDGDEVKVHSLPL